MLRNEKLKIYQEEDFLINFWIRAAKSADGNQFHPELLHTILTNFKYESIQFRILEY